MAFEQTNREMMAPDFSAIKADAGLKEAYEALRKNLEASPQAPAVVVVNEKGKYAGVLTVEDFMKELRRLYRDACDKPGQGEWIAAYFTHCELVGIKKVSEIMSGKRLSIGAGEKFEKACEMILRKKLNALAVVDEDSKPVGVIGRRRVLAEIGARMFK